MKFIELFFPHSDGEVMVDSENQLVDLLMPSGLHLPGEGGEQALPAGTRRYNQEGIRE